MAVILSWTVCACIFYSTSNKDAQWITLRIKWCPWDYIVLICSHPACLPSVSHAVAPSEGGQRRVSVLRLPSWRSWGSASRALQVYLTLCSCLAPVWVTLTGYQGVQGVFRLTSAHASKLHALYSWKESHTVSCTEVLIIKVKCAIFVPLASQQNLLLLLFYTSITYWVF